MDAHNNKTLRGGSVVSPQHLLGKRYSGRFGILPLAFITAILTVWPVSLVYGQTAMGAREVGLGQTGTALYGSLWSVFANPAAIDQNHHTVSFFGIRYYGFSNLTDVAFVANIPVKTGVVGAGAYRYGDDLFSESRLRLAYKNAFEGFHYGMVISYNHVAIGGGYGSAGALGIDAGVAASIAERLWIGARATNINRPVFGSTDEELPRELSIGLSYMLSDVALFISDVVKDVRFPLSWRGGVEMTIIERLRGRAGVTTGPRTFSLGMGYGSPSWSVNIVVQQHENPVLGLSPGFDLNIFW